MLHGSKSYVRCDDDGVWPTRSAELHDLGYVSVTDKAQLETRLERTMLVVQSRGALVRRVEEGATAGPSAMALDAPLSS
ncbi:hypothetical protein LVJ94_18675 [Pendulispora rubella]|uniref:Uncharacterized protein n=1 Tax=Pendulispora rubella TaxID=2741070 RepID=A0ABZ2LE83_9BACT